MDGSPGSVPCLNMPFSCNDVLAVTFTLDDKQQTGIQKSVRVRRIDNYFIGAEFIDRSA